MLVVVSQAGAPAEVARRPPAGGRRRHRGHHRRGTAQPDPARRQGDHLVVRDLHAAVPPHAVLPLPAAEEGDGRPLRAHPRPAGGGRVGQGVGRGRGGPATRPRWPRCGPQASSRIDVARQQLEGERQQRLGEVNAGIGEEQGEGRRVGRRRPAVGHGSGRAGRRRRRHEPGRAGPRRARSTKPRLVKRRPKRCGRGRDDEHPGHRTARRRRGGGALRGRTTRSCRRPSRSSGVVWPS